MATTEQFLISLGIDPASIKEILSDFENLKSKIEGQPIDVKIQTNAAAQFTDLRDVSRAAFNDMDVAAATLEDGIRDITEGLGEMKTTLIAVSGAAALVSGLGFLQAADESRELARANVILRDSQEELAAKQADLRQIADEVGLTYADVSAALFDVASAGFEGAEAVDAIRAAAQAAVPAGIDLQTAFNAIATAQNNFGITSEEAADKLVRIADVTRGTLSNVSQALGRIAPTASSVGISLDEVGAAFASITNKGESAEEASTLLFNAINKFLAPSDEAAKILKQMGISTGDAAFEQQSLAEKLEIVAAAADKGGTELSKVFDIRASRAIRAITSDMDGFQKNLAAIADSAGRTRQGLADFISQAGPQFDKFKTQVINLATAIGTDLLGVVVPLTTAIGNFIAENQALIAIFTEFALVVGVLAAAWLAYKGIAVQVKAAGKVLDGVSKVLSVAMGDENDALKKTISAWWDRIAAQAKAAKTKIGNAISAVVKWLRTENATIWLGIKAWGARIGAGLVRSLDALGSALVVVVQWIRKETAAMWAATTATRVQAASTGSLRGKMNMLAGAFGKNVGQASKAATAFGLLGAAMAGAKIGSAINDYFELEKATANYVKTGESSWKTTLTDIATLGGLSRARARVVAAQEKANKLTAQQTKILEEDSVAMRKFTEFTKLGLNTQQAFASSLGNAKTELGAFQQLQRDGVKLTDAQVVRMTSLKGILDANAAARMKSFRAAKSEAEAIQRATATLLETQDEWTAAVAKTDQEYRKLKRGAFAQTDIDVGEFEKSVALTTKVLQAQAVDLGGAQTELERLIVEGGRNFAAEFAKQSALVETKRKAFATSLEKLNRDIVIVNAKILANGKQFIDGLKAQADRQVQDRKDAVADLIAADEKLLTETQENIDKLIKARDKAIASVKRFSDRLEEAAIRRADPRLLEIIKLEREFAKILEQGIPTQKARIKAIHELGKELDRLKSATQEEIRLEEALIEAQERAEDARAAPDGADDLTEALEDQKKIQDELSTITAKRAERSAKAEQVIANAIAKSSDAIKTFADREVAITKLEDEREAAQDRLLVIADAIEVAQGKIRDRLKEQVKEAKTLIKAQLAAVAGALELAKIATSDQGALSPAAFETKLKESHDKLTDAFAGLRELAAEDIGASVKDAAKAVDDIGGMDANTAKFLQEVTTKVVTLKENFAAQNDAVVPAATKVAEMMGALAVQVVPSGTALAAMLESANGFGEQFGDFTDTMVEGFGKISNRLDDSATRLTKAEADINRLVGVGGGANGLPK